MATKTSRKQTRKVDAPVARTRVATEVPAVGLAGVTFNADGRAVVTGLLDVPAPTMQENPKYPWTPWNVDYLKKQLEKDLRRVAQTIANHQYVAGLLESRAAAKAERPAAAQPQQAAERPTVAQ